MTADPAAIAARLTQAQRRALIWLPVTKTEAEKSPLATALQPLCDMGLAVCQPWWLDECHPTTLGQAVRAVLEVEGGAEVTNSIRAVATALQGGAGDE